MAENFNGKIPAIVCVNIIRTRDRAGIGVGTFWKSTESKKSNNYQTIFVSIVGKKYLITNKYTIDKYIILCYKINTFFSSRDIPRTGLGLPPATQQGGKPMATANGRESCRYCRGIGRHSFGCPVETGTDEAVQEWKRGYNVGFADEHIPYWSLNNYSPAFQCGYRLGFADIDVLVEQVVESNYDIYSGDD